jgi:putative Mg2+ transporter-C (MgtC) family protein
MAALPICDREVPVTVDIYEMALRLLVALAAGALIGYERSYHGRPAGFRTHALVCMASSLLMLVTVYEAHWVRVSADMVRIDPTRMAQGIMTGIGFLGAGVIIKEGLSVRGLTTAASIWITAAIGILAGIGFYFPLMFSVVLTLGVLALFRWIEARMPSQAYFHFEVRFSRAAGMSEAELRALVEKHNFSIANFSYRLDAEGRVRRHSMVIRSQDRSAAGRLSENLEKTDTVLEFRISPTGD